jgi:hypothetical protein
MQTVIYPNNLKNNKLRGRSVTGFFKNTLHQPSQRVFIT